MPSDDFNRADGGLGADWTTPVGTWAVVSNQAECNDDDGATGYYARFDGTGADAGSPDMYTEVVTNSTQTDGSSNTGPGVRHRSGATTGYQFPTNLNDSCSFWRVNAGAETQIATFTTAIAAGDTVRLEAVGRTFRFKVNGALRNLLQDTNITDGQRGAMNGYNNVGTDVVRVDRFATGPLTDLLAPYVADWSAQTARITGTPSTPTIPAQVAAGDLVVVPATVRSTTSNITAPAGEGWSQVQLASGNSLRMYAFAKIWGLGGQTDDTTPSFAKDAGSVGFFTHALLFRNPAHATAPWTSVADAIVASNQQSNAAAATATAPSVTHDGTHRTVVRLFSSADDNALNAPSEGVLVTGGAAYDATDIAQACSVIEDITVTTNTGTATVAESVNGNDASNGITLVLAIPSTAHTLEPDDATQAQTAEQPAVTQTHVLAPADATSAQTAESPAVTQLHLLEPDDTAQAQVAEQPAVVHVHVLGAADSTQAQAADSPGLTQAHSLSPADATGAQAAEQPSLTGAHVLAPGDATAGQVADQPSLTQVHVLAPADAAGAQTAEQPSLVELGPSDLAPDSAVSAQVAESPSLGQVHVLAAADATGAQIAESPSLVQVVALAAADATQGQTAEQPTIGQVHVLEPADATSGQVAGSPTIASAGADVPSQGTYDTGRRRLVYDAAAERSYRTGGRLVYDP